uniref:ORF21 n=1 Tax=Nitrosopumilaceae spindle-shaped virus TaxID=3065433 RepID=A0AAT9JGB5_9VIRU
MNRFIPVLFLGIFCIGLGLWMTLSNHSYDCKTLPQGYWNSKCNEFNIESSGLNLLSIGLGIFTIVIYFKLLKTEGLDNAYSKRSIS